MWLRAENISLAGEVITADIAVVGLREEDRKPVGTVSMLTNYLDKVTTLGTSKDWADAKFNKWLHTTHDKRDAISCAIVAVQEAYDRRIYV